MKHSRPETTKHFAVNKARRQTPLPWDLWRVARFSLSALLLLATPALAEDSHRPSRVDADDALVSAHTAWSVDRGRPGDRIVLLIAVSIAEGFHIIADPDQLTPNSAFSPYPTQVQVVDVSPSVVVGSIQYPRAHLIKVGFSDTTLAVFDGQKIITIPMALGHAPGVDLLRIDLTLSYQACDTVACMIPQTATLTAKLPIVDD